MTLLGQEDAIEREAANPHTKTTVREEVRSRRKKFDANFEQKEGAIAAFFQPVGLMFHELLDLRVLEGEESSATPKPLNNS
jgi:hypothetical protein